jgi:hypothetical protein
MELSCPLPHRSLTVGDTEQNKEQITSDSRSHQLAFGLIFFRRLGAWLRRRNPKSNTEGPTKVCRIVKPLLKAISLIRIFALAGSNKSSRVIFRRRFHIHLLTAIPDC